MRSGSGRHCPDGAEPVKVNNTPRTVADAADCTMADVHSSPRNLECESEIAVQGVEAEAEAEVAARLAVAVAAGGKTAGQMVAGAVAAFARVGAVAVAAAVGVEGAAALGFVAAGVAVGEEAQAGR